MAGKGAKNDVATSEDPAAGYQETPKAWGPTGGVTGEIVWKVGHHRDPLSVTYQPYHRSQCDKTY